MRIPHIFPAIVFVLVAFSTAAFAAPGAPEPSRGVAPVAEMRYELSVSKVQESSFGMQWMMFMEARFHNDSAADVMIPWGDTLYTDMFTFDITDPDGKQLTGPVYRRVPPVLRNAQEFVRVPAHGSISDTIAIGTLGRNAQSWFFRAPGKYLIRPAYRNATTRYANETTGAVVTMPDTFIGVVPGPELEVDIPAGEQRGMTLGGRVQDENGEPVADALVEIDSIRMVDPFSWGGKGDRLKEFADRQTTGADGRFRSEWLPRSVDLLVIKAHHPKRLLTTVEIPNLPDDVRTDLVLTMPTGRSFRGRVLDAAGQPIEGVRVQSYPGEKTTHTDPNGEFSLHGLPTDNLHLDFWRHDYTAVNTGLLRPEQGLDNEWTTQLKR